MASLRQKMMQPPLLLDVATRSRGISVRKAESDWDEVVGGHYARYADVDGERCDREKFKNETQWARHELAQHGFLAGEARQSWEVTDKGVERLRQLALQSLKRFNEDELGRIAYMKGSQCDAYIHVLRALPAEELIEVVQSSFSVGDLFLNGFQRVPANELPPLLTDLYEILLEVFYQKRNALVNLAVQ